MNKAKSTLYNRSNKGRYRELKRKAKIDSRELSITFEQYSNIIKKNKCYYCDTSLKNTVGHSLNRVNNNMGYTLNNVKPCCGICNKIMNNFTVQELKCRLIKIYKRIQLTK